MHDLCYLLYLEQAREWPGDAVSIMIVQPQREAVALHNQTLLENHNVSCSLFALLYSSLVPNGLR
jgi:hypothetical protein